ncbi:MAG: hypothetical protein IJK07_06685 [Bacteroidales bacterium]|nr:hypothetical protein [Bacteroidales bacterium]
MKTKRIVTILLTLLCSLPMQAQLGVGKWRDCFSYYELHKVLQAGDRIYASAAGGLFYYDLDDLTVNRMNKTTILNDVGISTFAYDQQTKDLVIAYNNANIDIVRNDKVTNISDIKRNNIGGSKNINSIRFKDRCAYIACGFGIVVVDLTRNEIKETFYLGEDGTYLGINDIAFTDSIIVAATDNGILYADKDNPYLNINTNWTLDESSLLAGLKVKRLETGSNGQLVALAYSDGSDTTVYRENGTMSFAPLTSGNIRNIKVSQNKLLVCHQDRISIYDGQYSLLQDVGDIDWMKMDANDTELGSDGTLWIAHQWAALASIEMSNNMRLNTFYPQGPSSDNSYRLTAYDNELMVSPGGHTTTYSGVYLPANVFTFDGEEWKALEDPDHLLDGVTDIIEVAVNPRNQKVRLAAAWRSGIVEITDNKVTNLYNETNSDGALQPYVEGSYNALFTGAIAYDNKGNAWITNSLKQNGLAVLYSNGSWQSFNTHSMVNGSDLDHIIWDSIRGLKIFWGRANKIFVHDGESKMAYIDPNNGAKLETSIVNCVVQDHNGNIWIGTNKGIKVVYNLSSIFDNGGEGERSPVTCNNILYNENGISEYLMAYESVTTIVVDGANRKWVGTSTGGLYLLSANGLEQIEHFTAANSPLFSDKIVSLAIMPWSGQLFIITDKGLETYRSTATYAFSEPMDDIHAFPNPVRPDYDGPIAIKGFTRNGIVHITDAAGNTVFSTRANGGQAIWNGCTNSGERVASGIYYVFASAEDGSMRSATKIMVIR